MDRLHDFHHIRANLITTDVSLFQFVSGTGEVFNMWTLYGIALGVSVLSMLGFLVFYNREDLCGCNADHE